MTWCKVFESRFKSARTGCDQHNVEMNYMMCEWEWSMSHKLQSKNSQLDFCFRFTTTWCQWLPIWTPSRASPTSETQTSSVVSNFLPSLTSNEAHNSEFNLVGHWWHGLMHCLIPKCARRLRAAENITWKWIIWIASESDQLTIKKIQLDFFLPTTWCQWLPIWTPSRAPTSETRTSSLAPTISPPW